MGGALEGVDTPMLTMHKNFQDFNSFPATIMQMYTFKDPFSNGDTNCY